MRKLLRQQLKRIKMVLIDVDGVLARPQIIWAGQWQGEQLFEIKEFCVHDGSATWAARAAGLKLAVVSGRESLATRQRMAHMRVDELCLGDLNKLRVLERLKQKYGVNEEEMVYIGDDFLDLPIMRRVGIPIAVRDATPEVKRVARYITKMKGGEGAVGEVLRLVLQAQGKWAQAVETAVSSAYHIMRAAPVEETAVLACDVAKGVNA